MNNLVTFPPRQLAKSEMDLLYEARDAARTRLDFIESQRVEDKIEALLNQWMWREK